MRSTIRTAAVGAVLLLGIPGAWASTSTAAAVEVRPADYDRSVVSVVVVHEGVVAGRTADGGTTEELAARAAVSCTGWFVSGEGHIATAGHCVEAGTEVTDQMIRQAVLDAGADVPVDVVAWEPRIDATTAQVSQPFGIEGAPLPGATSALVAQIVDFQGFENGDNALLRVANVSGTPALPVAEEEPQVGDAVVAIGFPGLLMGVSDANRQPPSHKSGTVSSVGTSGRGLPQVEIDADVAGGMSGGPVLNDDGAVIGSVSAGFAGAQSFNFVTDTGTLRSFLAQNGVAPVAPGPEPTAPSPPPSAEAPAAPETSGPAAPVSGPPPVVQPTAPGAGAENPGPPLPGTDPATEPAESPSPTAVPEDSGAVAPSSWLLVAALVGAGLLATIVVLLVMLLRRRGGGT